MEGVRAAEMAQWVKKAFAIKSPNLSVIPSTHVVEGENRLLQGVL